MLRAGLIGVPGSGKTTVFQSLTGTRDTPRPGHPTTEPHLGIVRVPDARLDRLATLFAPRRKVPATIELADLGGRPDARALVDVTAFRAADALLHVIRLFRDPRVPHPLGSVDPGRDARLVEEELILADLALVERRLDRLARDIKKGAATDVAREQTLLERCRAWLEEGRPLRTLPLDAEALKRLRGFQLLSAKPLLVVLNLDEADLPRAGAATEWAGLAGWLDQSGARAVALCARIELELTELEPRDAAAFLADWGLVDTGLARVARGAYDLLGYISFFTIGEHEVRAWSIPRGTTAQAAAGQVHTDMARGFIKAEVVRFEHLVARGSLAGCREHGELRLEGKEYIVQDGDVIYFRFAA